MSRYDRTFSRYDAAWRAGPHPAWYPGAYWAGAPIFGWGWGLDSPGYGPMWVPGYPEARPPVRPEDSPTYGRRGDEAARRYARSHGYDEGYEIRARRPRRGRGRG